MRAATASQNQQNSKWQCNNTTGVKGVFWSKSKKWVAKIVINGKAIHLGSFDTKERAALAYQKAARHHFGEFAD